VPRFQAAHLSFGWGNDSLRDVPLQTDGELKYYQRCDHPVCGSATHDPQRTPLAVMREELRHAVDPVNADTRVPVQPPAMLARQSAASSHRDQHRLRIRWGV
jgi:hypothetical protein